MSLGGDIAVAGEPPAEGWLIQASEDSGAPISEGEETISIRSGGIATSSTTVRRWTRGGVVLHHIIDPATGLPSDGPWRTATVVAGDLRRRQHRLDRGHRDGPGRPSSGSRRTACRRAWSIAQGSVHRVVGLAKAKLVPNRFLSKLTGNRRQH